MSSHGAAGDGTAQAVPTPRKRARQPTPSTSPQDAAPGSSSGSGPRSPTPAASRAAAPAATVPAVPAPQVAAGQASQQAAADCFLLPRQPTKRRLFGAAAAAGQPAQPPAPAAHPAQPTVAERQQTAALLNRLEQEVSISTPLAPREGRVNHGACPRPATQPAPSLASRAPHQRAQHLASHADPMQAHSQAAARFAERWGFDLRAGQPLPHPGLSWERA